MLYSLGTRPNSHARKYFRACELGLVPRLCAIVHWISEVRLYTYGLSEVQLGLESKLNLKLNLTQSISTTLIQCLMKLHKLQITSIEDIHPIKTHIHYFAPPLFSSWRRGHWTAACASRQSVVTTVSSVLWHWVGRCFSKKLVSWHYHAHAWSHHKPKRAWDQDYP